MKRSARAGLSPAGSTLTAITGTASSPRSSSAPRICWAIVGQSSLQVVYMKVTIAGRPR